MHLSVNGYTRYKQAYKQISGLLSVYIYGITVMKCDGFEKPNEFGYFPDGYHIQIKAACPPDYPPTIVATSPCFPGDIRRDGLPVPKVIQQGSPAS